MKTNQLLWSEGSNQKYLGGLTTLEIQMIESRCRSILERLGYTLNTQADWGISNRYSILDRIRSFVAGIRHRNVLKIEMGTLQSKQALISRFRVSAKAVSMDWRPENVVNLPWSTKRGC